MRQRKKNTQRAFESVPYLDSSIVDEHIVHFEVSFDRGLLRCKLNERIAKARRTIDTQNCGKECLRKVYSRNNAQNREANVSKGLGPDETHTLRFLYVSMYRLVELVSLPQSEVL